MRRIRKTISPGRCYELASDGVLSTTSFPIHGHCKSLFQRETRADPQRCHVSSDVRQLAQEGRITGQNASGDRSKWYHNSSKHAGIAEHPSTHSPADTFLADERFHQTPQIQENGAVSSIRQRLKQWRKENESPNTLIGGTHIPGSMGVHPTEIPLPASSSLGQAERFNDPEGDEMVHHGPNPHGEHPHDWEASTSLLGTGDLVDIKVPETSGPSESLCVFVRMLDGQSQFITSKGYWYVSAFPALASGKIEKFASPGELASVVPYLPDIALRKVETSTMPTPISKAGDMPIAVTVPIVDRLVQVEQEISAFRRKYALAFGRLYEMLADDKDLVEWTMEDFVPKVFGVPYGELSIAGRLAIDRFASNKEHGIVSVKSAAKSNSIWVQPKQDMWLNNQVIDWARKYQDSAARAALGKDVKEELRMNPLSAFITKAHRLILKSRKIRSPTTVGLLGPSAESGQGGAVRAVDTGETFSEHDKTIVRFLFDASQMLPPLVHDDAHSICALIYRAIGAYPNLPLGRKVARLFLQELGVISPWTYRRLNQYQLRLPGLGIWPYQDRLLVKAEASNEDLGVFQDSVQHVRKDWGQMPVYCIDSWDTVDIDDGLSIERDANRPDCVWIHVHIANPAAYITRAHPIAVSAKEALSSTYTLARKFAMMPPNFVQNLCSLAPNRPAITVSTMLQADGSVADIEVSLGIIHNIVKLTPDAVDEALGGGKKEIATMVVGGAAPVSEDDGMNAEALRRALPDLLLMRQFLSHRFSKRIHDWPEEERMKKNLGVIRSHAWTSLREELTPLSSDRISHWKGDPVIVVEGDRFPRDQSSFDFTPLVEHAMLLAGESAAKWCKDREIPILFQVATPHPLYPVSKLNQLKDTEFRYNPAGRLSAVPEPHWSLNMWQYAKVTSPIRRYTDLVNQWQMQGYLDAISRGLRERKGSQSSNHLSALPFTRHELESASIPCGEKLLLLRRAANLTIEHWICQAFFRAFHFKEAELPEVWDFMVIGPRQNTDWSEERTGIMGYLSPFHAGAELLYSEEQWEKDLKRNQYLPVKIESVDAEQDTIMVRAVGFPSDKPTTTNPVHIRPSKNLVMPGESFRKGNDAERGSRLHT